MGNDPVVEVVDTDHCVSCWKNFFIQVWRSNPIEQRTREMRAAGQRFLRATTGDVGAIVVVESNCATPDPTARSHSADFIGDLRERGKGIVLVFEGEGFRAAASRAVMVGLMMASRSPIPYKVARVVSEVEPFLQEEMKRFPVSPGELHHAVEWTRNRIRKPIP